MKRHEIGVINTSEFMRRVQINKLKLMYSADIGVPWTKIKIIFKKY